MTVMTFDTLPPSARTRTSAPAPAPAPGPAPSAGAAPLRLTRRGRALLLLALVTLLLVAFSLGRTSADAGRATPPVRATTVVQPGETLWAIAHRVAPGTDPRETVARLTSLNDLDGRPIVAGQRLVLPR